MRLPNLGMALEGYRRDKSPRRIENIVDEEALSALFVGADVDASFIVRGQ